AVPAVVPGVALLPLLPAPLPDLFAPQGNPAASTVFWINPLGGDWDNPANWSSGAVPGAGDDAVVALPGATVHHSAQGSGRVRSLFCVGTLKIQAGALELAAPSGIDDLWLQGGLLTGPGELKVNSFTWTGGQLSGPGDLTVLQQLHLAGPADKTLDGRTLTNA